MIVIHKHTLTNIPLINYNIWLLQIVVSIALIKLLL